MRNRLLYVIAGTTLVAACSDSTGPSSADTGRIRLSLAIASGPARGPSLAAGETYSLGGTTVTFTKVQLVLREVELKRTEQSANCSVDTGSDSQGDDDCEEFVTGPVLLDLPLNGLAEQVVTINADTGTYRELEFEIHRPEDNGSDGTFLAAHPDFRGVSIRAEGTWNGTPFVYVTDLSAEQETALIPPLVVAAAGSTDLTLRVDLRSWFLNGAGTAFVNPGTANKGQPNEGLAKENIKRSFDAFEDDDHDGERDD